MSFSNIDIKLITAVLIACLISIGLTFFPTDTIYKAMERSTSYYTEDFSIKRDIDNDGIDEYIENLSYSDGGHVCSVYKIINDSLYVGYVTDLFDEPYDETGIGNMKTYYDRENNYVLFIYKVNGKMKSKKKRLDTSKIEFVPLSPYLYDHFDFASFEL